MATNLWTDEETQAARVLIAKGADNAEFLRKTNRTKAAAHSRIRWLDDPMERDRSQERARRSRKNAGPANGKRFIERPAHAPAHVIAAARERADAPRTLTAWLCGDPGPGQSALDRRATA